MEVNEKTEVNKKYFGNLSPRERAIFEGGISMGALFHQFIGTPVNLNNSEHLEKTMEKSLELQPCIKKVEVKIDPHKLKDMNTEFDYISLSGDILDVRILSEFEGISVLVRMEYLEELKYPLMYIDQINE